MNYWEDVTVNFRGMTFYKLKKSRLTRFLYGLKTIK